MAVITMMICLAQRNNVAEVSQSFFVSPSSGVTYNVLVTAPCLAGSCVQGATASVKCVDLLS
jgi:hypothetical protein